MQQKQQDYNTQSVYRVYYTHFYPFKSITRALTCGLQADTTASPQYRDLRFECVNWNDPNTHWSKKHFDRRNTNLLRAHIMSDLPQSIHIGQFMPLLQLDMKQCSVPPTGSNDQTRSRVPQKNKCAFYGPSTTGTNSPEYVSPLHETRGSGYAHFVTPLKELVFDIDVPGFHRFCPCVDDMGDNIRTTLCPTCGLHIEGACVIMQFILTEQLGYELRHLMCVFSGGKGIHCFVNAPRAMSLNETQRLFIYDAIQLSGSGNNAGTGNGKNESGDRPLFAWIRIMATHDLSHRLKRLFRDNVLVARNLLMDRNSRFSAWALNKLQRYYPAVYRQVAPVWEAQRQRADCSSLDMWDTLRAFEVYRDRSEAGDWDFKGAVKPSLFLIYRLYYPMVDKAPLRMSHAIKLPFSIHGKTGALALPMDASFLSAPDWTRQICHVNALYEAHTRGRPVPESFKRGIELFNDWIDQYDVTGVTNKTNEST